MCRYKASAPGHNVDLLKQAMNGVKDEAALATPTEGRHVGRTEAEAPILDGDLVVGRAVVADGLLDPIHLHPAIRDDGAPTAGAALQRRALRDSHLLSS